MRVVRRVRTRGAANEETLEASALEQYIHKQEVLTAKDWGWTLSKNFVPMPVQKFANSAVNPDVPASENIEDEDPDNLLTVV